MIKIINDDLFFELMNNDEDLVDVLADLMYEAITEKDTEPLFVINYDGEISFEKVRNEDELTTHGDSVLIIDPVYYLINKGGEYTSPDYWAEWLFDELSLML